MMVSHAEAVRVPTFMLTTTTNLDADKHFWKAVVSFMRQNFIGIVDCFGAAFVVLVIFLVQAAKSKVRETPVRKASMRMA